jgi:adenylate cyclase
MAHFGTLEDEKDSEYRAVAAGLEFMMAIRDMNEERKRQGKDPIEIGVGINTGPLLAGFIGASQRLEYTCIGDTVNTSSRICGMAEENQVLISETTYEIIKNRCETRCVGAKVFKGKSKEVMVYEVVKLKDPPAGSNARNSFGMKFSDRTLKLRQSRLNFANFSN